MARRQKRNTSERINSVDIISRGDQVSFVTTASGMYLYSCIPDARYEMLDPAYVMGRVESLDHAQALFRRLYGI